MNHLSVMQNVLKIEAQALESAQSRLTSETVAQLVSLFEWLTQAGGNLVVCGVGKSGLIGLKIAATFSSLGLPSFFLHPTEALHGDLGRVTKSDVILLISKSGTTAEILEMLPYVQLPKERLIALVGNPTAAIAKASGVVLDASVEKEACLNDLAPTTSTTLALALGDAMAVLFEAVKGISKEQFAVNHPAGLLGKSLSLTVEKLMLTIKDCAIGIPSMKLQDALLEMTRNPVGILAIVENEKLYGILAEGDIRRALMQDSTALTKPVSQFMNPNFLSVKPKVLAYEALKLMENRERPIAVVPVVESGKILGVLRLHDLFRAGFVATKEN